MTVDEQSKIAVKAKNDIRTREQLIQQCEQDILKIASKACYKYIDKSDDEWSIALYAFSKAIDNYEESKGNFMTFASVVIKRDLIDYHRNEEKHSFEVLTSPEVFDGNADEGELEAEYAVAEKSIRVFNSGIAEEITAITDKLKPFGFSFMDLTECSPKQERSRSTCNIAINTIADDTELLKKMQETKQLPASEIVKQCGVSQKILDKYRKYIIASAIILSDDYPCLAWYLKPERRKQA